MARKPGPPVAALAIGGVALLLLVGGGFLGYRMMSGPATPPVTAPATLPPAQPPATVAEAPPTPAPEPLVEEGVTIVGQPTPKPVTPPSGAPSAVPPTTLAKGKPTPPPTASTVPAVDPAAVKAQQVAGLLGQADASMAARNYDAAIGHYEEALKLEPENAKALAGKASAASLRDAARRAFVTGRTVVIPAKQEKGALAGFEGAAVQKAPDFSGRMEFAVSPAQVKPGDTIRIQVSLTNDGKKTIKIAGVALAVTLNGKKGEVPFSNSAKEIEPGQKAVLGEVPFTWPEGVTFWAAEATVSANKGDSLRAQVTWK